MINLDKKYEIILTDCPWHYNPRRNKSKFGQGTPYDTLSTKNICDLNVGRLFSENSILFMWGTWPRLNDCLEVIVSWGFKHKTIGFIWVKTNLDGSIFSGPGNYSGSNTEYCLLSTKGKPLLPETKLVPSTFCAPKTKHSEKPNIVHEKIDLMYGMGYNKLELFARRDYGLVNPDWDCSGLELDGFDLRTL